MPTAEIASAIMIASFASIASIFLQEIGEDVKNIFSHSFRILVVFL